MSPLVQVVFSEFRFDFCLLRWIEQSSVPFPTPGHRLQDCAVPALPAPTPAVAAHLPWVTD